MAIDPDVIERLTPTELAVAELEARVAALETAAPPPSGGDGIITFGPGSTAAEINDAARWLWQNDRGGQIRFDGGIQTEGPIYEQPGVEMFGVGTPMMFTLGRTYIEPQFSGPVFVLDDGKEWGQRDAWGSGYLHDIQIHATRPGVTAIFHRGGNNYRVANVMSTYGTHPLEYGMLVDMDFPGDDTQAQWGNGDYPEFHRLKFTRAITGCEIIRNAPDQTYTQCMFYGTSSVGSRGIVVHNGANNNNFLETHVQKYDKGYYFNSWENRVVGGSWENKSASPNAWAEYAIRLGSGSRGNRFDSLSFAQVSKVQNLFVIDAGAQDWAVTYPRGEIGNISNHVPAGMEDHFIWLP